MECQRYSELGHTEPGEEFVAREEADVKARNAATKALVDAGIPGEIESRVEAGGN